MQAPSTPRVPPSPPIVAGAGADPPLNQTLTVIAGVGVLLLAMGVGVLIGRSSSSAPRPAAAPQVITVGSAPSGGSAGAETTFTSDWPSGKSGYTVQLQTLPESGTSVSQIESAKSSATSQGATSVGALKSEEFGSLAAGDYVIYSGDYKKQAEAQKALAGLSKKFPGAKVIHVANGGGSASQSGAGKGKSGKSGVGSDLNHPAPPSVLEGVGSSKGKSYVEKSRNLPNVVETG